MRKPCNCYLAIQQCRTGKLQSPVVCVGLLLAWMLFCLCALPFSTIPTTTFGMANLVSLLDLPQLIHTHLDQGWFDRYVHRFEMARFPKAESKKEQLRKQVGQDVDRLLTALDRASAPQAARDLPEVTLLRQIFAQHYEKKGDQVQWRDGPAVHNNERIVSPYDPEARSSRKRDTTWLGYKVHLTETCDQDREVPHLITHVETTPATIQDSEML